MSRFSARAGRLRAAESRPSGRGWGGGSKARRSRAVGEGGYTLIELLAVMAILGTVLAMLTSLFSS